MMGTPCYQPYKTGYNHLLDIYSGAIILCELLAIRGEVYDDLLCGSTSIRMSNLGNKITLAGLGTVIGGSKHVQLMEREDKGRDWGWRKKGLDKREGQGRSLITKLVGISEANNNKQLQSLNIMQAFPMPTVREEIEGEARYAAEWLLRVLVYECCSIKEAGRLKGLQTAILAAKSLAHCYLAVG